MLSMLSMVSSAVATIGPFSIGQQVCAGTADAFMEFNQLGRWTINRLCSPAVHQQVEKPTFQGDRKLCIPSRYLVLFSSMKYSPFVR